MPICTGDLFRGLGAQGLPASEVDFPSLEFPSRTCTYSRKMPDPPLPLEEPAIDNPLLLILICRSMYFPQGQDGRAWIGQDLHV